MSECAAVRMAEDTPLPHFYCGLPARAALDTRTIARATAVAAVIAAPSIAVFLATWQVLDDLFVAAIAGAVVHFVAMGFAIRISKKFMPRTDA